MNKRCHIPALLCLILVAVPTMPIGAGRTAPPDPPSADTPALRQFTSGGLVLGFAADAVYVASGTHAYRVEFVGAAPTTPVADPAPSEGGPAAPLSRVTYPDLWPGVTLTYDAPDGAVLRSSYRLAPFADPAAIRLRYNVPVQIEDDGTLRLDYATGVVRESAPVAWQERAGRRVPVAVAFQPQGEREVSFRLGAYDPAYPLTIDPTLTWNGFLGGSGSLSAYAIAVDSSGNVYLTGSSNATWGAPIRAYSARSDAFVAKLDSSGALLWHTFLGGSHTDTGTSIALDGSGNITVVGSSSATWGAPVRPHSGSSDAFVARLNSSGGLTWNTFLGGSGLDYGLGVALTGSGVAVAGYSGATWGAPVRAYSGGLDAFAAQVNNSGALVWNTFLGQSDTDMGFGVAVEGSSVYVTGTSGDTWGAPVRAYTALDDAFVAQLDSNGGLNWNTFLGGDGNDGGLGITAISGGVVVVGSSTATWGAPLRAFEGNRDAFAARLNSSGALTWNTFLGASGNSSDHGQSAFATGSGDVFVVGFGDATWGTPVRPYTGGRDVFVARLNGSGALTWNTFLGGSGWEYGYGVAVTGSGNVVVAGRGDASWGAPIRPHVGEMCAFAAQVNGSGALTWNTFFSGEAFDAASAIAVDRYGNIYVAGRSNAQWGNHIRAYTALDDAFVAKLDNDGTLLWSTFLGGAADDAAYALTIYSTSQVVVAGASQATWGAPDRPHMGQADAFVAALIASNGYLLWNNFLGGTGWDYGYGVAADGDQIVVAGFSNAAWGTPIRAYTGNGDAFAARLAGDGALLWHTFLGGSGSDYGYGIAAENGTAYVVGSSMATWGAPVRAYTGQADAFVARLSSNGALGWNTFLGGSGWDDGYGITIDINGNLVVAGYSLATWGAPVRPYTANGDAFAAQLNATTGALNWNTFLGGDGWDSGAAVVQLPSGDLAVVGSSSASWGAPLRAYTALEDAFIAHVNLSGALTGNAFLGGDGSDVGHAAAVSGGGWAVAAGESNATWGAPTRAYTAGWDAWYGAVTDLSQRQFLPRITRGQGLQ